jgi:arsenate reductase
MLLVCYDKCGTCRKARKWLDENRIGYEVRDIKTENPTLAELKEWQKKSGIPWNKFFNTSGKLYREMGLSKKIKEMSEEEIAELLATDGMLVKRPVLISDDTVLVGFKETDYEENLK